MQSFFQQICQEEKKSITLCKLQKKHFSKYLADKYGTAVAE